MVSKDEKRWRAAAHIVMIVLSALAILPFILLIIASFTDEDVALKYGSVIFRKNYPWMRIGILLKMVLHFSGLME